MDSINRFDRSRLNDIHMAELTQYAFELSDRLKDADAAIGELIAMLGDKFSFDCIAVKEIVENGAAIRCTYEWNADGQNLMLNTERRFLNELDEQCEIRFGKSRTECYTFTEESGDELLIWMHPHGSVKSAVEIPLLRRDRLIGFVDCFSMSGIHGQKSDELSYIRSASRVMSSYLFGMRKAKSVHVKLRELEHTDQITNLPNHEMFLLKVKESLAADDGMSLAIIFSDVVSFKYLNDKYGVDTGNLILKLFAESVYDSFNMTVSCCREYSDNFIYAVKFPIEVTEEAVRFRVDRMVMNFRDRIADHGLDYNIGINSGICLVHGADCDIEKAVTSANFARKVAREMKGSQPSRSAVFHNDMVEDIKHKRDLAASVQQAIDDDEFCIVMQPKGRCDDLSLIGAEALIRWKKGDGTMIYPDDFIPAFEDDGCIEKVDFYVYRKVFEYLRGRLDKGLPCVRISMNVSRYHLMSDNFINYVEKLQDEYDIPSEYLEFEVTENLYLGEQPSVVETIDRLHARGISVSLDDFGSQFSSLDILTRLPFDVIKLDKIFMKNPLTETDKIIISSIIEMARKLKTDVLCEGVEYEEQRRFLVDACCDQIQGYLFHKPLPISDFDRLLDEQL